MKKDAAFLELQVLGQFVTVCLKVKLKLEKP